MADFKQAYAKTALNEGGYANHPNDKGGETYKGIARLFHPNWKGWVLIDSKKGSSEFPKNINDKELEIYVEDFYRLNFWDPLLLDHVTDQSIAEELYDTGVNMGTSRAVKFLQRGYNLLSSTTLEVDGKMGSKTLEAVNSYKYPATLFNLLNILQGYRYVELAEKDPSQEVFMRGWLNKRVILRNQL